MNRPCVYIITDKTNANLYISVTDDLARQIFKHKCKLVEGVPNTLQLDKLVWYQHACDMSVAMQVERRIQAGSQESKIKLIRKMNPQWRDLYGDILE